MQIDDDGRIDLAKVPVVNDARGVMASMRAVIRQALAAKATRIWPIPHWLGGRFRDVPCCVDATQSGGRFIRMSACVLRWPLGIGADYPIPRRDSRAGVLVFRLQVMQPVPGVDSGMMRTCPVSSEQMVRVAQLLVRSVPVAWTADVKGVAIEAWCIASNARRALDELDAPFKD